LYARRAAVEDPDRDLQTGGVHAVSLCKQTYRGRCVVALDTHETALFHLSPDTLQRFARDVARAAAALQRAFRPDKIDYAIYGDLAPHLHYHVVPKYRNGPGWGEPFALHPPAPYHLIEAGYKDDIAAITAHLSE
jgi:diadenosine tetraphosphate (Ap4A) HIT family hydrolase